MINFSTLSFQRIVIIIGVGLLGIVLLIIAYMLSKKKGTTPWPPITSTCPDYWLDAIRPDGTYSPGARCEPNERQYNSGGVKKPVDFTVSPYVGDQGECAKYTWANNLGVVWDGITYGVQNPCNT